MNMNCEQLETIIDDFLDQRLDSNAENEVQTHIESCDSCNRFYLRNQQLQSTLRLIPQRRPSPEFVVSAIATAKQQGLGQRARFGHNTWLKTAGAMAAGLALWLVFGLVNPVPDPQLNLPQVQISLNQTQNVNLTLKADYSMESVEFAIRLPEGVDLAGMPGKRDIQWQGSLRSGANLLSLPVIAHQAPQGQLEARVTHAGKSKIYRLQLALHGLPI